MTAADRAALLDQPVAGVFGALQDELQCAVMRQGYAEPTPIQEQSIPHLLEGRDIYGCAQTGTGKTAAFVLPVVQRLAATTDRPRPCRPRALILAPTRELAGQIGDSISTYAAFTPITHMAIFGGVGQRPQVQALREGVDIVVATPGRLLDLINQGEVRLDAIEVFVLDEGDRMLDMGFLPDIRRVVKMLPAKRQSLLFSATLPEAIAKLAGNIVSDPVRITIAPEQPAVERITQKVMFVSKGDKVNLLTDLLNATDKRKVIVFTQMKHVANRVAQRLEAAGISAAAIHGNKSQSARTRALDGFKAGRVRVLVATDIAARGIDVPGVSHVVNYDLPLEAETYVHRIGRTARAGASGDAVSFCCAEERGLLRGIERLLKQTVLVDTDHDRHCETAHRASPTASYPRRASKGGPRRYSRPGGPRRPRQR
jgi:ATP-dependent RNA helicase RhlE